MDPEWFYFSDNLIGTFFGLVRNYCLGYNVFPVQTTIEGVVVNKRNHKYVYDWLISAAKSEKRKAKISEIYSFEDSDEYKATALRLIVSGKFDTLHGINKDVIKNIKNQNVKKMYDKIKEVKIDKTSGWIDDFFFYFNNQINSFENLSNSEELKSYYIYYFPELFSIIKELEKTR